MKDRFKPVTSSDVNELHVETPRGRAVVFGRLDPAKMHASIAV